MASNHQLRPPLVEWFAARPVGLLVGFTVTGWLAAMLWPNLLRTLGILGYGNTQFLDSYAVLAAVDALGREMVVVMRCHSEFAAKDQSCLRR